MNEKYFVNKDIALKLNKLGYKETCGARYRTYPDGSIIDLFCGGFKATYEDNVLKQKEILAPTLQEVQTWLRETYGIDVLVTINNNSISKDYCCYIYINGTYKEHKKTFGSDFKKCLEYGIKEALTFLE